MYDKTFTEFDRQLISRWKRTSELDRLLVAHVTDSHVLKPQEDRPLILCDFPSPTWGTEHLQDVVRELHSLSRQPDLLLLGGDMTHTGDPAEWNVLFGTVEQLPVPILVTLGNHEHRNKDPESTAFQSSVSSLRKRGFQDSAVAEQWAYAHQTGAYRFLVLDSMDCGDLGAKQHEFLCEELKHDRPTIVLIHRPVIRTGKPVDDLRLIDPLFEKILRDANNLIGVVCGHAHCRRTTIEHGRLHFVSPSVNFGNDDRTGYRLFCLSNGRIAWSGTRAVAGDSCHAFRGPIVKQKGGAAWEEF
jgi:3',5'-cyclic AMP phosphodiesterase CpdA